MKVRIYSGSLKVVEKSGVGQAIFHQMAMLKSVGADVSFDNSPDTEIVHINTVFPNSFFAAINAKLHGKKVIYYAHSTMEDFRNSFVGSNFLAPLFRFWIKRCYNRGNIIITPTPYSKKLLQSYGIKKSIFSLSNGIDTDFFTYSDESRNRFRSKYNLKPDEKVVMSAGHFINRKGIIEYIDLARKMPDVKFFWFGYTSPGLIIKEIAQQVENAPENMFFPGYITQEELRDAYCGSDVFDFMSFEETEGIVVLEALACKIQTVVRNIPVYEDWLINGDNCYKANTNEDFYTITQNYFDGKFKPTTDNGLKVAKSRSIYNTGKKLLGIYKTIDKK